MKRKHSGIRASLLSLLLSVWCQLGLVLPLGCWALQGWVSRVLRLYSVPEAQWSFIETCFKPVKEGTVMRYLWAELLHIQDKHVLRRWWANTKMLSITMIIRKSHRSNELPSRVSWQHKKFCWPILSRGIEWVLKLYTGWEALERTENSFSVSKMGLKERRGQTV